MQQIAAALVKAQRAFSPALKTNTNPAFRSRYADLAACIEAVIDALNENGIALMQPTRECSDGVIVETLFLHESGETISGGLLHVPAVKHDPQGYGSALTYARRYSLMAACGIAPEDDDGHAASQPAQQRSQPAQQRSKPEAPQVISSEQATYLAALITTVGADKEAILQYIGKKVDRKLDAINQIPVTAFDALVANLQKRTTNKEAATA